MEVDASGGRNAAAGLLRMKEICVHHPGKEMGSLRKRGAH